MMKKCAMGFVILSTLLLLVACGTKSNNNELLEERDKQIAELQAQIAELQEQQRRAEEEGISAEPFGNKVTDERTNNEESEPAGTTETTEPRAEVINIGDHVSTDFVEISFDAVKTANEIKPDNPSRVYRYQADQENETYLYVVGTIKNISGDSYEFADSSYVKITFDEKYNYSGSVTADEGGDFSYIYAYLKPFQSEKIYWIFSVPDELIDQYSEAVITIGFNENFQNDWNRDIDTCDYSYMLSVTK